MVGVVTLSPAPSQPDLGEMVSQLRTELESAMEDLDQQKRVNLALVKRQVSFDHKTLRTSCIMVQANQHRTVYGMIGVIHANYVL